MKILIYCHQNIIKEKEDFIKCDSIGLPNFPIKINSLKSINIPYQ